MTDATCELERLSGKHGPVVVVLPCGHGYCAECRDEWSDPCLRCGEGK